MCESVIDQVGLFDPRFFLYYEEVDHCQAVKAAGWKVIFHSGTTVTHIGGARVPSRTRQSPPPAGRSTALQIESGLLYHRKHHGRAGLAAVVVLTTFGDALLTIKWLLKQRTVRGAKAFWTHAGETWRLLRKTAWGQRATR